MADKLTLDRQAMKDRSTAHLRIYVGGLTENATVDDLYEQFIRFGQVSGIVINRNFGFVQFENESSVQEAISKADGTVYQGKSLHVRPALTNPAARSDKHTVPYVHVDLKQEPELEAEAAPVLKPKFVFPEAEPKPFTSGRDNEVVSVTLQPDIPPAVALNDNLPIANDEGDEPYDNYGNYIGDQNKKNKLDFREEEHEHEDSYSERWNEGRDARGGGRGRPGRSGPRVRGPRGRGGPGGFRDRSPVGGRGGDWGDRGGYDRYSQQLPDYPRAVPVTERNDCEIIVVSKALTEYAEYIEGRLKRLGIVVDLLFPMEDVPIGKVLGNIASRGCLYAILVMPQNQENRSLTLTILHGLPQEHRNMPLEDALQLLSRNFQEVQRGGPSGREAVYALLGQLADGRTLTVLQYDKVLEYLQERREQQVKIELGEPLTTGPASNKTQADLQQRILSILNDKKVVKPAEPTPPPPPTQSSQNKLLSDPTVRKALDSILQKFT